MCSSYFGHFQIILNFNRVKFQDLKSCSTFTSSPKMEIYVIRKWRNLIGWLRKHEGSRKLLLERLAAAN